VALSDPELDLLRELLVDDPGADVWVQVAEELVRRSEWSDAVQVLKGGLAEDPTVDKAWVWYARACLETVQTDLALAALEHVPFLPNFEPESARVRILVLEQGGMIKSCRQHIAKFLHYEPDDVVVTAALERLDSPIAAQDGQPSGHTPDPLISMDRADRYVAVGRPDRAARVYRRILYHNPGFQPAEAGLRELGEDAWGRLMTEDLSHEIFDPATAPPALDMPEPKLSVFEADEEVTEPRVLLSAIQAFARGEGENPLPSSFGDPKDKAEFTAIKDAADKLGLGQVGKKPRRRRRRRSLLQH
jgi:hypothetical protein